MAVIGVTVDGLCVVEFTAEVGVGVYGFFDGADVLMFLEAEERPVSSGGEQWRDRTYRSKALGGTRMKDETLGYCQPGPLASLE
jgi:hypothetical protein